jgi:hypothetical protein
MASKTSKTNEPKTETTTAAEPTPTDTSTATATENDPAAALGFRVDSKTYQAATLFLRPNGATMQEVKAATGGPQRNLLKKVEAKGHKVTKTTVDGANGRRVTSYHIELVEVEAM